MGLRPSSLVTRVLSKTVFQVRYGMNTFSSAAPYPSEVCRLENRFTPVVNRSIPLNRSILSYHFILTLARDRNRAYQTKSSQPVVIMRLLRQQEYLQRAAQVYIQAAFLRFAIQRRRAMQHRIGGMNQPVIVIARQSQLRRS